MNKTLPTLLAMLFMVFLVFPGASHAGDSHDFLALQVPNVPQAASFFQSMMNCDAVDQDADPVSASMLLDCGNGAMVELSGMRPTVYASRPPDRKRQAIISFSTADATSTLRWLHSQGIAIVGHPVRVRQANGQEKTTVDFVAPWGQTMQLVSYAAGRVPRIDDAHAIRLASP